jgi:hypothetical protein
VSGVVEGDDVWQRLEIPAEMKIRCRIGPRADRCRQSRSCPA